MDWMLRMRMVLECREQYLENMVNAIQKPIRADVFNDLTAYQFWIVESAKMF